MLCSKMVLSPILQYCFGISPPNLFAFPAANIIMCVLKNRIKTVFAKISSWCKSLKGAFKDIEPRPEDLEKAAEIRKVGQDAQQELYERNVKIASLTDGELRKTMNAVNAATLEIHSLEEVVIIEELTPEEIDDLKALRRENIETGSAGTIYENDAGR